MAKNLKQVALIQHRTGKLDELPKQLNKSEFGFAEDTNDIFIGNPDNPTLAKRIEENIFPYGNVQVLTEFTDNLNMLKYHYKSNNPTTTKLPIKIVGETYKGVQNSTLFINDIEITFTIGQSLQSVIETINNTPQLHVKAQPIGFSQLALLTNNTSLTLKNGDYVGSEGPIQLLGFGPDNQITILASDTPNRYLQQVLDDYVSIKNFGVIGDGISNDSETIYNAIVAIYKENVFPMYLKKLYIPSGTYNITSQLPLPNGCYLSGDGIGRTVLKASDLLVPLFVTMDNAYNISTNENYGMFGDYPSNITIENMTIDMTSSFSDSFYMGKSSNITFKNVEFKGANGKAIISLNKEISFIKIENCFFSGGQNSILSNGSINYMLANNNIFQNCSHESLSLTPTNQYKIKQVFVDNTKFENCGFTSKLIINLNENTEYVKITNSVFDKQIMENIWIEEGTIFDIPSENVLGKITSEQYYLAELNGTYFGYIIDNNVYDLTDKSRQIGIIKNVNEVFDVENIDIKIGNVSSNQFYLGTNPNDIYFGYIINNNVFSFENTEIGFVHNGEIPIKKYVSSSSLNYFDCWDSTINPNKFFKFNFTQPSWEFIKSLTNENGDNVVYIKENTYEENGELVTRPLTNSLEIEQGDSSNNNTISISGKSPIGNISISNGKYGDISLGENSSQYPSWETNINYNVGDLIEYYENGSYNTFVCVKSHTSSAITELSDTTLWTINGSYNSTINVKKSLNINEGIINKDGDIAFKTSSQNTLNIIDDYDMNVPTSKKYADRIGDDLNNIPNVEYVNKMSSSSFRKLLDYKSISQLINSRLLLVDFDKKSYGDELYLNNVAFNVRVPYYPIISSLSLATDWKEGLQYTVGDIVNYKLPKPDSSEFIEGQIICLMNHISSVDLLVDWNNPLEPKWIDVYSAGDDPITGNSIELPDAKYITMIADNGVNSKVLLFKKDLIDLSMRDTNSENYLPFALNQLYNEGDIVSYINKNYQCIISHTSSVDDIREIYNPTLWKCVNESGFNFSFEFPKQIDLLNYDDETIITTDNIISFNFSNYKLYIDILDAEGNRLPIFKDLQIEDDNKLRVQITPSGAITITVGYIRSTTNVHIGV